VAVSSISTIWADAQNRADCRSTSAGGMTTFLRRPSSAMIDQSTTARITSLRRTVCL